MLVMKQHGNTLRLPFCDVWDGNLFFSALTVPSQILGRPSVSRWKGKKNPASRQKRKNSRLQIWIECKHWQTQMAHWKIHQHGKIAALSTRAIPTSGLQVSNEKGLCTCGPPTTKPDTERTRGGAVSVYVRACTKCPIIWTIVQFAIWCCKMWPPSTNHGRCFRNV